MRGADSLWKMPRRGNGGKVQPRDFPTVPPTLGKSRNGCGISHISHRERRLDYYSNSNPKHPDPKSRIPVNSICLSLSRGERTNLWVPTSQARKDPALYNSTASGHTDHSNAGHIASNQHAPVLGYILEGQCAGLPCQKSLLARQVYRGKVTSVPESGTGKPDFGSVRRPPQSPGCPSRWTKSSFFRKDRRPQSILRRLDGQQVVAATCAPFCHWDLQKGLTFW